jgi:hypothetical protein
MQGTKYLTLGYLVLFEKLIVSHPVKKLPAFMEVELLSPCSKKAATESHPEAVEYSLFFYSLPKFHFNIILQFTPTSNIFLSFLYFYFDGMFHALFRQVHSMNVSVSSHISPKLLIGF